jgi:predicted permease
MTPLEPSLLPPGESMAANWRIVSPDYFTTMGIPVLAGRALTDADTQADLTPAVVSKLTARRVWGDSDPLGHTYRMSSGLKFRVVGVVEDIRDSDLRSAPFPCMYFPAAAMLRPLMDIAVRTVGEPNRVIASVRQKLHDIDPDLPMANVKTMDEWLAVNAAQPRLNTALFEVFAALGVIIAAIGIYGVVSYTVRGRTREIGIRMALGAKPGQVASRIVREGMTVAAAGVFVGIAGALALSRAVESLLYGTRPRDPVTFAAAASILLGVACAASLIPALRASRIDPVTALRHE